MMTSVFVTSEPDAAALAGLRNVHALQRGMIAHVVRRVAVRHLPHQLAAIEIDRGEHAVRRLHDRQPLHGQAALAAGRRVRRRRPAPRAGGWRRLPAAARARGRARRHRRRSVARARRFPRRNGCPATPAT